MKTKTIYKYPIDMSGKTFSVMLPSPFKFLRTSLQNNQPFMWLEVDKDAVKSESKFCLWGTGQDIPDSAAYLGTFDYGPLVLHLYKL